MKRARRAGEHAPLGVEEELPAGALGSVERQVEVRDGLLAHEIEPLAHVLAQPLEYLPWNVENAHACVVS
jgi:hypothetical protein